MHFRPCLESHFMHFLTHIHSTVSVFPCSFVIFALPQCLCLIWNLCIWQCTLLCFIFNHTCYIVYSEAREIFYFVWRAISVMLVSMIFTVSVDYRLLWVTTSVDHFIFSEHCMLHYRLCVEFLWYNCVMWFLVRFGKEIHRSQGSVWSVTVY